MEHFSGTRFILGKSFKFCGYQSREIIIKLRDEKEISKMLEFAAKSHDVLDENEKVYTLGRFHRKPESLCILPGLVPVFKLKKFTHLEDSIESQNHSVFYQG